MTFVRKTLLFSAVGIGCAYHTVRPDSEAGSLFKSGGLRPIASLLRRVSTSAYCDNDNGMITFEGYTKLDTIQLLHSNGYFKNHALHHTLAGENMIEKYEVFSRDGHQEIMCRVKFGQALNGHPGIVHGGITALVFDNSFGWLFFASKIPVMYTANLTISYKRPVLAGEEAFLVAKVDSTVARKMFMSAKLLNKHGEVLAESNTLFIRPRTVWETINDKILKGFF